MKWKHIWLINFKSECCHCLFTNECTKMFAFILFSCRQLPLFTQLISAFSFARLNSSGNVRFACRYEKNWRRRIRKCRTQRFSIEYCTLNGINFIFFRLLLFSFLAIIAPSKHASAHTHRSDVSEIELQTFDSKQQKILTMENESNRKKKK